MIRASGTVSRSRRSAHPARSLYTGSERSKNLETLLDDSPFLDERHSVLNSVNHNIRTGRNDRCTERACGHQLVSAEMLVGDLTVSGGGNVLGDHRKLSLDLV